MVISLKTRNLNQRPSTLVNGDGTRVDTGAAVKNVKAAIKAFPVSTYLARYPVV